jgi:hypothetical protein
MYVRARVLRNGVKMEMLSPQNDRAMKRNVNFLLAATVSTTYMYLDFSSSTPVPDCNSLSYKYNWKLVQYLSRVFID